MDTADFSSCLGTVGPLECRFDPAAEWQQSALRRSDSCQWKSCRNWIPGCDGHFTWWVHQAFKCDCQVLRWISVAKERRSDAWQYSFALSELFTDRWKEYDRLFLRPEGFSTGRSRFCC
mmetsp:Transcript_12096/g.25986  ORF Transcript_12096/g.25986 Transcript_12096/m.25986 type:complete len:119 (-) Transcript_12096:422-778(-)